MLDGAMRAHPLLRVDDVAGALYSPGDGTIDAFNVVDGYRRVATARHGAVFSGAPRCRRDGDAVAGVVLDDGRRVDAPVVVNCGAWAPAHAVTEAVPGMHGGLPNVRDHDLSIYFKAQGDALALGGYETNPEFWRMSADDEKHFSFGLFDLDWETFDENIQNHMRRCPSVEDAGIKSTVCGPESFTPDHKPLVGPAGLCGNQIFKPTSMSA
ncbi:oxidoreductase [Aureococcus anophagefferens]|nr:oxidoreductase [Aureococcus anophagefferens]